MADDWLDGLETAEHRSWVWTWQEQRAIGVCVAIGLAALAVSWNSRSGFVEYDKGARPASRFEIVLNEATWPELTLLPGIGKALAKRIVEYRQAVGRVEDLEELRNVKGLGPKKLQAIRPFLRID